VQAVVSKGMDNSEKIDIILRLHFLEIIEHFNPQFPELDIDCADDDEQLVDERFFHIMAGSINRVGIWCLELHENAGRLLPN
jgi:hypothetical protein